jgi:5'-deoxynucleotidase YfbR-like HD superfamily hydrolase
VNLNIRELLDGNPVRLRYVFRYSTSRVQVPESVAEHSFYVALYCLFIGRWVLANCSTDILEGGGISTEDDRLAGASFLADLLQRALLHDMEEARSGDFPRNFKRSTPELHAMLETASTHAMEQVVEGLTGPLNRDNPIGAELCACWQNSKNDTVAGRVLEFADFLSVLSFLLQEDNRIIKRHVGDMHTYWQRFLGRDYDFIRPLVDQAGAIMTEVGL